MEHLMELFARELKNKIVGIARGLLASGIIGVFFVAFVVPAQAANKSKLGVYQHGKPVEYLPCD